MNLIDWLPAVSTTGLLSIALWLGRNLIGTRLTKSVQFEYDNKLEEIRADFRAKEEKLKAALLSTEAELNTLRSGALTAMTSRQIALDKRRLEAVEQIWSNIIALAPVKAIASIMANINADKYAEEAAHNHVFRDGLANLGSNFDIKKIDVADSLRARPFVTPMVWALYSAYQAIALFGGLRFEYLKMGVGTQRYLNPDAVAKLVNAALPDYDKEIDIGNESNYFSFIEEIETRLLCELQKMMMGVESDNASVERSAEILNKVADLRIPYGNRYTDTKQ